MFNKLSNYIRGTSEVQPADHSSAPAPKPTETEVSSSPAQRVATPPASSVSSPQQEAWSASKMRSSLMVTLGLQKENPDRPVLEFDALSRQSFADHALSNQKHKDPDAYEKITSRPPAENFAGVTVGKRAAFAPKLVEKLPEKLQPQHAYIETPVNQETSGRGKGADIAEKGVQGGDPSVFVEGSAPYEVEIMAKMKGQRDADGPWIGLVNDCHSTVERATEDVVPKPPSVGRFGKSTPEDSRKVTVDNLGEFANPSMRFAIDSGRMKAAADKMNGK